MTNPFQTSELLKSISNYPISKVGDVPGHEFHGNQHTGGIGGGGSAIPARQSDTGRYQAGSGRYQASTESNGLGRKLAHFAAHPRRVLNDTLGQKLTNWLEEKTKEQEENEALAGKPGYVQSWSGKWVPANPNSALDRAMMMEIPTSVDRTHRPLDNGLPTL